MSKKVGRIRDVARETGLSIATISRVMNGATNVKPATRKKVLDACLRLDYVPNPAARILSTKRSKSIAVIIPTIEHSVFAKYITAIEQSLGERGYTLVLAISNADPDEELKAAIKLLAMGAEAFILSGAEHHPDLLSMFKRRQVPYVFSSIYEQDCDSPTVGYDNYLLGACAVEYLSAQGHKDIAVIHGPLQESDRTRSRRAGASSAARQHTNLSFFETTHNVEGGKLLTQSLLEHNTSKYTAILCFSDVLALGVYFALFEAGISIPQDISVMGFDNLDWSAHVVPALTTIDLPAEKMGIEVARQLIDCLENKSELQAALIPAEIIERQSVREI